VVEAMQRDLLEGLEDLGDLIGALRAAELDDVVWAVVGGNPADYFKLRGAWHDAERGDVTPVVSAFVTEQLNKAIEARDAAQMLDRRLSELYARFAAADAVSLADAKLGAMRPSPDKVLREVTLDGESVLVPSTPAMAVVLRYGLAEAAPSLDALKAMLFEKSS